MSFWNVALPVLGGAAGLIAAPALGVGAGAGLLGGAALGGGISSGLAQAEANQQSIGLSHDQMAFQERMSNSAYQRAVDDMRKAGINPMLAISQGGASTPSGSMASIQAPDFGKAIMAGASTAMDVEQKKQANEKIKSDVEVNKTVQELQKAQAQNTISQSKINSANAVKASQEAQFYKEHPWAIPLQQGLNMGSSAGSILSGAGALMKVLKKMP